MRAIFRLVVIVDWSASSTLGPKRPSPDRCWLAWGSPRERPAPLYCRTRAEAEAALRRLLAASPGPALVGFDFPFGYPAGSGLGGGRALASRLAGLIEDAADGRNNRFAVAAALNAAIGRPPGPFWGCPPAAASATLASTRPDFAPYGFAERRVVELRLARRRIMTAWQLLGSGSVGSQSLLGLPAVHRLLSDPMLARRTLIWPFETGWDAGLADIVLAEVWPSLARHADRPEPVKDARQVAALRDWLLAADASGRLRPALARPPSLATDEARICELEEGWILGAETASELGHLP